MKQKEKNYFRFQSENGTGDIKSKWNEVTKILNMKGGTHKNTAELCTEEVFFYFRSGNIGSVIDELDDIDHTIVGIITIEALEGDGIKKHGLSAAVRSQIRFGCFETISAPDFFELTLSPLIDVQSLILARFALRREQAFAELNMVYGK